MMYQLVSDDCNTNLALSDNPNVSDVDLRQRSRDILQLPCPTIEIYILGRTDQRAYALSIMTLTYGYRLLATSKFYSEPTLVLFFRLRPR